MILLHIHSPTHSFFAHDPLAHSLTYSLIFCSSSSGSFITCLSAASPTVLLNDLLAHPLIFPQAAPTPDITMLQADHARHPGTMVLLSGLEVSCE